jgi:hypothetical protein
MLTGSNTRAIAEQAFTLRNGGTVGNDALFLTLSIKRAYKGTQEWLELK